MASDAEGLFWDVIVEGQFFSSQDFPAAEKQNVTPDSPRAEIRFAAVVDKLCATPINRSIDNPLSVELEQIEPLGVSRRPDPLESFLGNTP